MFTRLILGCRHCEEQLKTTKGYSYNTNGDLQLPFSTRTEFKEDELTELFTNHYHCPFCGESLEITPRMMKCITNLFQKNFHVDIQNDFIQITNGELSFAVPVEKEINSIKEFLSKSGVQLENAEQYLPTKDDIELIQIAIREFDTSKWSFRIESGKAHEPFVSATGLWFNGI
ncbi:hypothetical protein [Ornithinibacillus contaminans]|uniref:hypothetical protein n=1 Tax=Ornithinibacillus contaminans TaxID=694055 RepID=UPI0006A7A281|nr:hypothetical protein [Ornithinibacillus contaminans]